mmetsp:Transcript_18125/g.46368  ORF Transcript_18125/g.46368 Transcript_18125/m.46368 type:complete len:208 (-) Transcript_18125:147-770(-)
MLGRAATACSSRCVCGKVSLRLLAPKPVLHLQCGCRDCRQAHEFVASRGGPPIKQPPLQELYYFVNDVAPLDESAANMVELQMLRHGGSSTRLVSKCCASIIAVDHPAYQGNVLMVPSDVCNLEAQKSDASGRIYMGDWDELHDGMPPPAPPGCTVYPAVLPPDAPRPWRQIFATPLVAPRQGVSLQQVYAKLGSTKLLGLEEGARF